MKPGIYGPYPNVPITARRRFQWPNGARLALWVVPNIEFFHLDDPMPGNSNERIARAHAKIPAVRNWALRDYGNRVGIWRFMEVLSACLSASSIASIEMRRRRRASWRSRCIPSSLAPRTASARDAALNYICSHDGMWLATGKEIIRHYAQAVSEDGS
jgi:hypothetical protein